MEKSKKNKLSFSSKLGGMLAVAGSAVGLGNIWRFPTEAGSNGGSAFILVYLAVVFIFGIPMLLTEFIIGRRSRANVGNAYNVLAPNSPWRLIGHASAIIAFVVFCYYSVVVAWVLYYFWESLIDGFNVDGSKALEGLQSASVTGTYDDIFSNFIQHPFFPLGFLLITLFIIHYIITAGVQNGIEKVSKLLLPALFTVMVILAIFTSTMPGAAKGYSFLFSFNLEYINTKVCLAALGQCFYSFSIGMGLVTYASYFQKENNLNHTAASVGLMDTLAAVIAGLIIFPAVFSIPNASPSRETELVFVTLPSVFNSFFEKYPLLNWLIPSAFYFILFIAAVTSAMFLHEVATAYICEKAKLSRKKSALIVTLTSGIIGSAASLSMGPWHHYTIAGMNFFELLDFISSRIFLPLTGLGAALFVGWKMKKSDVYDELTSGGMFKFVWFKIFMLLIRFVIPILIITIMVTNFIL